MSYLESHWFWKYATKPDGPLNETNQVDTSVYLLLMRVFYAMMFYFSFLEMDQIQGLLNTSPISLLWPVVWVDYVSYVVAIYLIFIGFSIWMIVSIVFTNSQRVRIVGLVFYLFLISIQNSFGKISHSYHHLFYPFLAFALFPKDIGQKDVRVIYNTVFVGVLLLFLFSYSLSGFWKFRAGIKQFGRDEVSIFSIESLTSHLTRRSLQTHEKPLFGDVLIQNSWIGSLMLLGAVLLELLSVFVLFKPQLYKLWGVSLILMHYGIYVTMGVPFPHSVVAATFMLVVVPFDRNLRSIGVSIQDYFR